MLSSTGRRPFQLLRGHIYKKHLPAKNRKKLSKWVLTEENWTVLRDYIRMKLGLVNIFERVRRFVYVLGKCMESQYSRKIRFN